MTQSPQPGEILTSESERLAAPSVERDFGSFSQAKIPTEGRSDAGSGWMDIADVTGVFPVLVSRPADRYIYTPTTAFKDVTGVWRVYRSEGGNEPLPFEPTHYQFLPPAPEATTAAEPGTVGMERGNAVRNEPKAPAGDGAAARERLAALSVKSFRDDVFGGFQTRCDLTAILSAYDRQGEDNERLRGALELAANRLDRLSLETPPAGRLRAESVEWIAEARNAARARQGGQS